MEQQTIENTIRDKAKEWAADYGEDFVVELAGDFLSDAAGADGAVAPSVRARRRR